MDDDSYRHLSQLARPSTMEDQYQRVIREPQRECKPASAALDAELRDQEELPGSAGRFQWCDPAKYTKAIAQATLKGRLNKQLFDSIVAHIDYDLVSGVPLKNCSRLVLKPDRATSSTQVKMSPANCLGCSPDITAPHREPFSLGCLA